MASNEVQVITITGAASGTFTVALDGHPTSALDNAPTAAEMQAALEALPNIGVGNVGVVLESNWVYAVTFQNALGNMSINTLQLWDNQLKPPSANVAITVRTEGTDSSGDAKQDAIDHAYQALKYISRRTASSYPYAGRAVVVVLSELLPFITVPP